ncbi:PD-(D/E)XK nuclease family protein [Thermoleophilum album]|uniref:DNA 3'-5' helicase n=1 Tax=Thermoleophilum album TaxID=29539 RepID=A0A1H6FNS7_THEAL|nr:PD-(D/E)XK nuclease family protein [Thermoleophilum album]SEH11414.1 Part of AAA domain-containing protein [Thermoleophilum album]
MAPEADAAGSAGPDAVAVERRAQADQVAGGQRNPAVPRCDSAESEPRTTLISGPPGAGRTTLLLNRFLALLEASAGGKPSASLLTADRRSAELLLARTEAQIGCAFERLNVLSVADAAAQILRRHARPAGLDPAFPLVDRATRVLLIHEHLDHLALVAHDPASDPAVLAATLVEGIDRLKGELLLPRDALERAEKSLSSGRDDAERARAARAVEVARAYELHERLLAERGWIDRPGAVLRTVELLRREPETRRACARWLGHLFVDQYERLTLAEAALVAALAAHAETVTVAVRDEFWVRDGEAARRSREVAADLGPTRSTVRLTPTHREPVRILVASETDAPAAGDRSYRSASSGWRFLHLPRDHDPIEATARVCGELVAAAADPGLVAVVCEEQASAERIALALERHGVPAKTAGRGAFFRRPEVRDVLAWLRALCDPTDAAAAVRALTRPPIALAAADVARITQVARRRRVEIPRAVEIALSGPQLSPEGRERASTFLELFRRASQATTQVRPDAFVLRLIQRVGLDRSNSCTETAAVERARNLALLVEVAARLADRDPDANVADFVRLVNVAARAGIEPEPADGAGGGVVVVYAGEPPVDEVARLVLLAGPTTDLAWLVEHAAQAREQVVVVDAGSVAARELRERLRAEAEELVADPLARTPLELLLGELRTRLNETIDEVAERIAEMRLDTHVEIDRAVVACLELIAVTALAAGGRSDREALAMLRDVSAVIARAATPAQRELLANSRLEELLTTSHGQWRADRAAPGVGTEERLDPFIPRSGEGLMLSASDLETYRLCPLRYKFARVYRVPQEPTLQQRFGIVLHQALERFHLHGDGSRNALLRALEACWRRSGIGDGPRERALLERARRALERYWESLSADDSGRPVWFERNFAFRLGPHLVRGRVDRVDLHRDGSYELIDYKTGKERSAVDLADDIQLSLYQLGAREAWGIECGSQSYLYLLSGEKVAVPATEENIERVSERVRELAASIAAQRFEPRPEPHLCAACDYRIICPASAL